ncbi:M23 family metallopeptidase [Actinophytocola gossypii]|uniref:M23 family metallopeptidase n=1 Tax=Actinophytocola gossypii TaxID=2812003 RepID=UPI0021A867ED|nr:M23 family metallopeptidase [Actinophytocola gossypii]
MAPPSSALRGRVVVAAVALGAIAAASAGQTLQSDESSADISPLAGSQGTQNASAAMGMGGSGNSANTASLAAPEILTVAAKSTAAAPLEAQKIAATDTIVRKRAERLAAIERERNRPKFVKPALGRLSSGYGARWGGTHEGLDIANHMGTPLVSAADGVVIEAGPASGFGLWVRIEHADGTVTVYGHMDTITVNVGESVKAGDQIATMGSRGYSTGPHLHFEVWDPNGYKINPLTWLNEHGVYY